MKIFITGGTGFVGGRLAAHLMELGHEVTVLTRKPSSGLHITGVSYLTGDPAAEGAWQDAAAAHATVINLAGAGIFRRWTRAYKDRILRSRIDTTKNLTAAIGRSKGSVKVMLSASAVGYYGFRGDEELGEDADPGNDFLASVCRRWEEAATGAEAFGARVVLCRLGIVLGPAGGALGKMLPAYRLRLGSRLGPGKNWFSWIHINDLIQAFEFLIDDDSARGPVNITAPEPVRYSKFHEALSVSVGKTQFPPPVPSLAVRLLLGEFGRVLVEGQRVSPRVLLRKGFRFSFPKLEPALQDLCGVH
jgi:uncharacterized protein